MQKRNEVDRLSDLNITDDVLHKATLLGFGDCSKDTLIQLREALWLAVKTKHFHGNMRYKDWVFLVKRRTLIGLHLIKCNSCDDSKRITVYEECPVCYGDGCKRCNGKGDVRGMIPCPDCSAKR